MLPALHGQLEGVTHHALHTVGGVDGDFGGHLVRGATADRSAGTAVQAFGAFTHDDEIDVTRVGERRGNALVQLGRTQVHVLVQVEAELEQQAAFQNARLDARIADGAQQDGVGLLDALLFLFREDRAVTQIAFGTEVEMLVIEFGDASAAFSRAFWAHGVTSLPMPSPGMTAMVYFFAESLIARDSSQ